MNRNILSKNLKHLRKQLKLTQDEFAENISITGSYISDIERGKSDLSDSVLSLIEINYRVSRDWLLKDEGEPFVMEWLKDKSLLFEDKGGPILDNFKMDLQVITAEEAARRRSADPSNPSSTSNPIKTQSPDSWYDYIAKTRFVLESKTGYANSLAANILSFHEAVVLTKKYDDLEKRLARLEKLSTVGREKEDDPDTALAVGS